jgi:hypothetical protein
VYEYHSIERLFNILSNKGKCTHRQAGQPHQVSEDSRTPFISMVGEVVVQAQITTGERWSRWRIRRLGKMDEMTLHLVVCLAY